MYYKYIGSIYYLTYLHKCVAKAVKSIGDIFPDMTEIPSFLNSQCVLWIVSIYLLIGILLCSISHVIDGLILTPNVLLRDFSLHRKQPIQLYTSTNLGILNRGTGQSRFSVRMSEDELFASLLGRRTVPVIEGLEGIEDDMYSRDTLNCEIFSISKRIAVKHEEWTSLSCIESCFESGSVNAVDLREHFHHRSRYNHYGYSILSHNHQKGVLSDRIQSKWQANYGRMGTVNDRSNVKLFAHRNSGNFEYFGLEDILSQDDIQIFQQRFQMLKKIFPKLTELELKEIVSTSPLFLTMEPEKFQKSVELIVSMYPCVDPSYLLSQKSPGLELLLLVMSGDFNFSERQQHLQQIIGSQRNITAFIHKIPHALAPRYTLRLQDQISVLKESFPTIDMKTSLDMMESCPKLLTCDIKASSNRVKESFKMENISLTDKDLYLIVKSYPQILLTYGRNKRLHYLIESFPRWNHKSVVINFPSILSISSFQVSEKYQVIIHRLRVHSPIAIAVTDIDLVTIALNLTTLLVWLRRISVTSIIPSLY